MNQVVARAMLTVLLLTASSAAQTEERWINPRGGNWLIAQNWSGGSVPNNTPAERFDATFKLAPAQPYTAVVNGKIAIDNLRLETSRATISVPLGSVLSVSESGVLNAGTLRLLGGKLSGGEWIAAPGVLDIGNFATTEFAGVKWRGDILLGAVGNQFRISGGLALNGRLALTSGGTSVTFDGAQSILGGNIFLSPATNSSTLLLAPGSSVTLSPSTFLNGGGGDFVGDGTLINKGLIKADRASKTLSIAPRKFINAGRMEGLTGATLVIGDPSGTWMQTGAARITAAGTLTLRGEWSNQGTISTSATVNLNGVFGTASLDGFSPAGGTVNITGTWDNRGRDYYLAGASTWNFQSGKVYGGTLISSPELPLRITGVNPVFESIAVQGPVILSNACRLNIGEGAYLPGPITFANDATVRYVVDSVMEDQTFAFSGTNNRFSVAANAELTIGQTLEGASFSIRSDTGGVVRNEGTIRATSGKTVIVEPTQFDNAALCETTGGTLRIGYDTFHRAWMNLPEGVVRGVNGTLELGGTWSNNGSIETVNSAVRLFGNFTAADLQSLSMQGGSLTLGGTLDNSNNTLTLNQATGNWTLSGSPVIRGGVLRFQDGAYFTINSAVQLRLEAIDVADLFQLGATSGTPTLTFAADATASGGVRVTRGHVRLEPTRTWNSELRFESTTSSSVYINQPGTVTLGPESLLTGGEVTLVASQGGRCVNQGTIRGDVQFRAFYLQGNVDNAGLIESASGGSISISATGSSLFTNLSTGVISGDADSSVWIGSNFDNYGLITKSGGTLSLAFPPGRANYGTIEVSNTDLVFTNGLRNPGLIRAVNSTVSVTGDILTSDVGDFRNEGGTFTLGTGILDNRGQTLQQNATTGSWLLGTNRTIRGGVIDQSDNVYLGFPYVDSNNTGILDGVTVRGDLLVSNLSGNAGVLIPNGIVMENGTIRIGTGAYFRVQNVLDNATIVFSTPTSTSFATLRAEYSGGAPVVFGPGLVISGGTARIDNSSSSVVIINQGTVSANVAARNLRFGGTGNYTNEGLIEARNGGTANLNSSTTRLTNLSNGVLTGGRWAVYSGSTLSFESAQVQVLDAELLLSGSNSTCAAINALNQVNGSLTIDAGRNLSTPGNLLNTGFIRVGRLSTLTVNGGFTQDAEAVLALDIGGATAPAYGRLAVAGSATLDGSLEIAFVSGYTPQLGDSFTLVTAQSVVGQFSDVQLPQLPPGTVFSLEYGVTAVELHVIAP